MRQRALWVLLLSAVGSGAVIGGSVLPGAGESQAPEFRNIQVLQSMTQREIQMEMVAWNTALGATCVDCHVQGDFAAETPPLKAVSRDMVRMVNALNDTPYFRNSSRKANCFMCHKGSKKIPGAP